MLGRDAEMSSLALFPSISDLVGMVLQTFLGFVLWVMVTPLRLLIGFLDPIFSPVTALFDFSQFIGVLHDLQGFFNAANYFVPFYAMVSIIQVTLGVAFILNLIQSFGLVTFSLFGEYVMVALRVVFQNFVDKGKALIDTLILWLLG